MILSKGKIDVKCKNVDRPRITKKLEIATKGGFPLPPIQVSNLDIIKNTFLSNSQWLKNPAYTKVSVKKEKKKEKQREKENAKKLLSNWFKEVNMPLIPRLKILSEQWRKKIIYQCNL